MEVHNYFDGLREEWGAQEGHRGGGHRRGTGVGEQLREYNHATLHVESLHVCL